MSLCYENAHCHTYYSNPTALPDSTMSIEDYASIYKDRGMQCLVMSEHGYRGNVWEQADIAQKYSTDGFLIKPICAAEVYFVPDRNPDLKDGRNFHLLLLAKDNTGFKQLNKALSIAQKTGFYKSGRLDFDLLSHLDYKHFICTTACVGGIFKDPDGLQLACQLAEIFKENFRLEVQYHLNDVQIAHNQKILEAYKKYHWPLFFATDSHYIQSNDKILRRELQLSSKIDMPEDGAWDLYLPTAEEAFQAMQQQHVLSKAQIEEAFENTLELREFEGFSYDTTRKFPISRPDLTQDQRNNLYKHMVADGYIAKAGMPNKEEAAQLHQEMDVIVDTGSADYFIGLHDMIERGKELGGILTTTSRGSACSYASNYALGFTSINRLKVPVKMYPERFISKDKLKTGMPDIDSNIANVEAFEQAGREIFGEHGCYPMIAFGTCKTLSAFKLLARARNLDFKISNEISKQISAYELDVKHAKENNQDDPDYDVDDDVRLEDYIDDKYMQLVNDSKQYQGIVLNLSPHPCAHLVYHKDLEEEIGIIRVKSKNGNKEPVFCVYIDGATADNAGFCKIDLLRVDVVKIINDTFKSIGMETLSADDLLEEIKQHPEVWDVYANGATMGCNQTEKEKTTQRVKQFKPKNTVELSAFVAAIRPGAKTLVDDYVNRSFHSYGIPAMDELLLLKGATGVTGQSSYLFYDEQILQLAQAAGIEPADAYALTKAIKKKKHDKVAAYKEKFIPGFIKYLKEQQKTDTSLAEKTANDVWTVILNSASYLFCCAHAYAMCIDSLYGAYLKTIAPYEFYKSLLSLYTDKGNKKKIALIMSEMKKFYGISVTASKFGQDNRDWYIDKEHHTISQSLSSVKYISQQATDALYAMKDLQFETFTDLLRYIQTETCINSRQIETLIAIGYFSLFGGREKLNAVYKEYREGKNKVTKTVKSWQKRMEAIKEIEKSIDDQDLSIEEISKLEYDLLGMCFTADAQARATEYLVQDVDEKYSVYVKLYNLQRGTSGTMKVKKNKWASNKLQSGEVIDIKNWKPMQRYRYKNGQRIPIDGERDLWLEDYEIVA